jgi:hypothetical protein
LLTYFNNNVLDTHANSAGTLIHIFKTNIFLNSLLLLLYTVLVRIHGIIYPQVVDTAAVSNSLQEWALTILGSGRLSAIVACLLVYLQALMINRLVIKNRMGHESSLLPGMLYVLGVSILPQFLQIHLPLLATTFLIVGLTRLYGSYKEHNAATLVFDVGFYIGIASIVEPVASVFFIIGYIGLVILRAVGIKDRLQYVAGAVVPYFLWFSISYWLDGSTEAVMYLQELVSFQLPPLQQWSSIYLTIACTSLSLVAVVGYGINTSKKAIQVQKKIDILYWVLLLCGVALFHACLSVPFATILMLPLSFFLAQLVLRLRGLLVAEVIHIIIVISVLMFQFGLLAI